ncbi:MAG TPA: TolC family protein [Gemmatimonadota bacterium]|nr:TolC family protein [Gemmatimonadota bacterium]
MKKTSPILVAGCALALSAAMPAAAQDPALRDTVDLSLGQALSIGLQENPTIIQSAADRAASGAGLWSAYGKLLPQIGLQGSAQKTDEGSFVFFGTEFESPASYSTAYQWDITHSLLDAGRDLFRIRSARADVDRRIAAYDNTALETVSEIKIQYLNARREEGLVTQAELEMERRGAHLEMADARHEVGAVTRSDVLQAQLSIHEGGVALLQARQRAAEARLALRRLLGGALPPGPIDLTSDFPVFEPQFDEDELVASALAGHPSLRESRAAERVGEAELWIARSAYLPTLQLQYSLARSVVDTLGFEFSDFDNRNFWAVSFNWPLFGRFERYSQTSRARAGLVGARQEERRRALAIEEQVRVAYTRLVTARAAHEVAAARVELSGEDLRLAEGRYETGVGTFLDLLDARVRAGQAETDLITSTYDFYLALVALERATGLQLFPERI